MGKRGIRNAALGSVLSIMVVMGAAPTATALPPLSYFVSGATLSAFDITATPLGQQKLSEFRADTQHEDLPGCIPPFEGRVYDVSGAAGVSGEAGQPDLLVIEEALEIVSVSSTVDGAARESAAKVRVPGSSTATHDDCGVEPSKQRLRVQPCFARLETSRGKMDACFQEWKILNDGFVGTDFYGHEMWASFQRNSFRHMKKAWIESKPNLSDDVFDLAWQDWSPRSDQTGNCSGSVTTTIGLQIKLVQIGIERTENICEEWKIDKSAEPGRFKNTWHGDTSGWRHVAHLTGFSLIEGWYPGFEAGWGFDAR